MPESGTYGFGRREGKHLNMLCEMLLAFADSQDIALPEMLGYLDMAKDAFMAAMVRPGFVDDDPERSESEEFDPSDP